MSSPEADLVLTGGPVFTADASRSWTDAVAVKAGVIVALGANECQDLIGSSTRVVDLAGRMAMPGFIDSHAHPIFGGLEFDLCDLTSAADGQECLELVAAYAAEHPDVEWIIGGGWSMDHFAGGTPTRSMLDAVTSKPVYLINRDRHGAWVNSTALRIAGVDASTPDPPQGRIERENDGTPAGTLHEASADLVARHLPAAGADEYDRALSNGQRHLHSLGVTGWQDALIGDYLNYADVFETYVRAERNGTLTARVVGALWWDRERGLDQIKTMLDRRADTEGGRFRTTTIKFMQDGVCENFTAAMLSPYLDHDGSSAGHDGLSYIDPNVLADAVALADHLGFQAHFHTIGDRAVREALDAVEFARRSRPRTVSEGHRGDPRHHLAHIQVIDRDDIPRFRTVGAAANMQPLWANRDPQMADYTIPFLGEERAERQYPFEALRSAGAVLVAGSDWPVSSANPLEGVHVAVNRMAPGSDNQAVLTPHQRLALTDALVAYTVGGAWINHLEEVTGSVEIGKCADLVVLDRDLFAVPADLLADASVDMTFVDGQCVYEREQAMRP